MLIPAPAWVSYPQIVHLCRAEPVLVPGDLEWGLKVSVKDLDRHHTKLTRGLILCSPCNPTGAVYTLAELKAIAEWAKKHEVWIISDEIYRRINYGPGPAPSLLDLPDELLERTRDHLRREQGVRDDRLAHRRRAGAAASDQGHGGAAVAHHHRRQPSGPVGRGRRPSPTSGWTPRSSGWSRVPPPAGLPGGALPRRARPASSSWSRTAPSTSSSGWTAFGRRTRSPGPRFCEQLMKQEGVALVPGAAFGDDRWVRLSYAVSDKELETGARPRSSASSSGSSPPVPPEATPVSMDARIEPLARQRSRRSRGAGIRRPTSSPAPSRATGRAGGLTGTVELTDDEGSVAVLDVNNGVICGLDVVVWPEVSTAVGARRCRPSSPRAGWCCRRRRRGRASPRSRWTPRSRSRPTARRASSTCGSAPRAAGGGGAGRGPLYVEVDQQGGLAGFWLTNVPPFSSFEGT